LGGAATRAKRAARIFGVHVELGAQGPSPVVPSIGHLAM
jgi:hypothetical protein